MTDQSKGFEIMILRPLQLLSLVSAIVFLSRGMWLWFGGCVFGILYLGIVGSKLHPLQSASKLAQSPVKGPKAQIESDLLPPDAKQMLIGHACTRVGIMIGIIVGVVSWAVLGWRWYFAFAVVWFIMMLSGALLKLAFKMV